MENKQSFVVKGVLAFPYLTTQDDNDKYSLQIGNLSHAAVDKLVEQGVDVKFNEDDKYGRGQYIQSTSKFAFKPKAPDGTDMSGMDIGYGSVVRARLTTYDWTYKAKSGTGVRVLELIIDEVVVPEGAGFDSSDLEEAL